MQSNNQQNNMNDELNTLNKSIEEANRLTQSVGASRDVNLQPLGTITSESLAGSATPIQLPDAPTPQYRPSPIVPPPSGTTFDSKAGIANTPPPTEKPGGMDWIKKQFAKLGGDLGQKAEFTKQEQEEAQLAQKREKQAQSYNAYQQAQLDLNRQIESLAGSGLTDVQRAAQEKEYRRVGNANIANLAIQAQADQNLLGAAEQTIKDKVDAQFSPIQDQIDWLTKFSTITSNDLTESESAILNSKIRQQETDYTNVTKTADELQQAMLQNGAPQTVYSAIDKISNDYVAGKIDAQTAQSRMRQAAGSYGTKKEKVTGDGAPTIKSINGVDMQWNPTTSKWETINTTDGNVDSLVAERGADKIIQLDSLINNTTGIKANAGLWRRTGLINKQVANDWSADAINVLSRLTV